jgi:hypothetical protein
LALAVFLGARVTAWESGVGAWVLVGPVCVALAISAPLALRAWHVAVRSRHAASL